MAAGVLPVGTSPIAAHPAASWANGDAASDVLLARDVFYRYEPKVSAALEKALQTTLDAAGRATVGSDRNEG